jgi:WD40 repeat protein
MPTGLSKVIDMVPLPDQRTVIARGAIGNPVIIEPRERLVRGTLPAAPMRALGVFGDEIAYADGLELARWRLVAGPTNLVTVDEGIVSTAISPDDAILAITTLRGTEFRSLHDGRSVGNTDASDGALLKVGIFSADGNTWLEAVANRPALRRFAMSALSVSGDIPTIDSNRRLASAGAHGILTTNYRGVISLAAPPFEKAIEIGHIPQRVRDLATATATGRLAVLGDGDSTVWIGDLPNLTLRVLTQRHPSFAVALSADGRHLALARDVGVDVIDVESGGLITTLTTGERPVLSLAFSHHGQMLAAGTLDGILCLWEQLADPPMVRIQAHRERIASVTFSHDGRFLVTGSWDQRVRIFGLGDLKSDDQQRLESTRKAWGMQTEKK